MGMRVVETHDVKPPLPTVSPGFDMVLGIDEKAIRVVGQVSRPDGIDDLVVFAQKHATAFRRIGRVRMCDNRVERGP